MVKNMDLNKSCSNWNNIFASKLRFFDTTLRDGEQTPGVSLKPDQKLEIATRLAAIGVDVVEAGSAATSAGEQDAIRLISDTGPRSDLHLCPGHEI